MSPSVQTPSGILRGAQRAVSGGQGIAGAVCLTVGVGLSLGIGPALVVLGLVLLFAAWSSR